MKATTLQKRLAKRYKGQHNSKPYQIINDVINGTIKSNVVWANTIRPCYTSGRGRFTKNMDYTYEVKQLLNLIGIKYESGNDAPRGGLTGNYIKVLTKIER